MAVEPARGDAHQRRLLPAEHLPVVGIGGRRLEPRRGPGTALFRLVRHRDDLRFRQVEPDGIEVVAVVALARAADHRHAVLLAHGIASRG